MSDAGKPPKLRLAASTEDQGIKACKVHGLHDVAFGRLRACLINLQYSMPTVVHFG